MSALPSLMDALLVRLGWTSLQAVLLIGAIWLICRQLPRLSAATRSLLWWLVGVQLLLGLALPTPVALPLLSPPAPATVQVGEPVTQTFVAPREHRIGSFGGGSSAPMLVDDGAAPAPALVVADSQGYSLPWRNILLALWLAGVLVQLLLTARHWREARAVLRASDALDDPALLEACRAQARATGLRRCPSLRVSHAIRSPQVSGWWRPVVLLPAEHALSEQETALALAHELAHLHRGDLWLGWVPAIAQRVFFFHPLVAWSMREYALNREAACDAQVMEQHHAAPQDYGRLLLRLGVAHPLHAGLAGASPTFLNLKRRLSMLQGVSQGATSRVRSAMLVVAVACAGVLPYRVTQAAPEAPTPSVTPAPSSSTAAPTPEVTPAAQPTPAAKPVPATQATPAVAAKPATKASPASKATAASSASHGWVPEPPPPPPPVPATPPTPATPSTPLTPPTPPTPPAPPPPATGMRGHHVDIDIDTEAKNGFALFDDKASTILVNGTDGDVEAAKRERKGSEPLLWFRRGDQAYVVRDSATIEHARAAYAPMHEIASMEGRIAGQQSRIASIQSRMASRQGELAAQQGELESRRARLQSQRAQLQSLQAVLSGRGGLSQTGLSDVDAQIRALDSAIQAAGQREQAGDREFQRQQEELARQEQQLEREQQALEVRQRSENSKADRQMEKLLDEAIAKGVARPTSLH